MALTEQLISRHDLLQKLAQGTTVLTGNNRLANTLIDSFDGYNIENKNPAWSSPDIIPINSWLISNWEQAILSGLISSDYILLSNEQECQVWEAIIKDSPYGNGLLRSAATAKSVSDAWRLLQNWNLSRDEQDYVQVDDAKAFHYWCSEFEKSCDSHNWIVSAQLASLDFFPKAITNCEIILLGFDEITPQMQLLFENLASANCSIKWLRQENQNQSVTSLECDDVRDEIETFANWVKQRLEHDSSQRFALVAPDISAIRPILLQTLERVLLPSNTLNDSNADNKQELVEKPWDISLGTPLIEYSIIKIAFQLLGIVRGKLSIETVSNILRSPFISGAMQENNQRALLDRQLRELGEPLVSLKTLQYYSGKQDSSYYCPLLFNLLVRLNELKNSCMNKAGSQAWTIWINAWLVAAGWGTGRTVSSAEYQTIEAWKSLLHSFTSLQTVMNKMSFEEAISCLNRLASDKIFQIQSKSAALQILGLYESIGLDFDYLWVMNLYDEVWPVSPRPNPFIPLHLQKRFGLPHASWERELIIAKQITKRLENSATTVIFSYPAKNSIQELRPSPLLQMYQKISKQQLNIEPALSWRELIRKHTEMEWISEEIVVNVGQQKVSGGSSIFKNQSLCPFRAFVENRLHARPMRKAQPGLDAMKRGSLLHNVLELFWKTITDQQQLNSKSPDELEVIIKNCIEQAITRMAVTSPDTFNECFTRIEKQRLLFLMLSWLKLESQRAAFKVVDTERELNININGVEAKLYIDRVDELENGHQLLIDYKTGLVSPSDWFGVRPNDPQLPLYSIASGENLSAVLFAQLRTGELKFNGVVEEPELIPNLPPNRKGVLREATEQWPEVLTEWNIILNSLAKDFVQSKIAVDPKDGTGTCRKLYCELSALCRINELIDSNSNSENIIDNDMAEE